MNIPINYRDSISHIKTEETKKEDTTFEEMEATKTPIQVNKLFKKHASVIYFLLWMLAMGIIASYWYGNKYSKLIDAIDRREELMWKMEYNNNLIKTKVDENATIRNQVLSDNEMMVEAIKTANQVKESKIVTTN